MVAAPAPEDGLAMHTTTFAIGSGTAIDVEIRALAPADREGLAQAFSRLSEQTRRRRFHGLARRLGESDLDRLTQIDHHAHEALAAIVPDTGRIVGVARYIALRHEPTAAEVAIAVVDEWQRRGIGRRLMSGLIGRARAAGVRRLLAYVDGDNRLVLAWIARAGGVPARHDGDASLYSIPLDRPTEERRAT
jgi:GNAT superfamily N-acetyltransferase